LTAAAVRARSAIVFAAAERGETRHFRLAPRRLDEAVRRVADITRRRYPDLEVPPHSRWRHFAAGGIDRASFVAAGGGVAETARARIDLAIVSVLLDAGAGPAWHYREAETGQILGRSEGLAVASLRAMQAGLFSADPGDPWRADAATLARITPARLAGALQHGVGNALAGLEGRAALAKSALPTPGILAGQRGPAVSMIIGGEWAHRCGPRIFSRPCCWGLARSGRAGPGWAGCHSAIAPGTLWFRRMAWCRFTSSASG